MRFCNLKTYLSTFRQLILFHPTIFVSEFVLGLFITTCTFSFWYIAGHVCLSRKLLHPFSGVNCRFNLDICFLTHLHQSHHMVWRPTEYGDEIGLLRSYISLLNTTAYLVDLCSLGYICPPVELEVRYMKAGVMYSIVLSDIPDVRCGITH